MNLFLFCEYFIYRIRDLIGMDPFSFFAVKQSFGEIAGAAPGRHQSADDMPGVVILRVIQKRLEPLLVSPWGNHHAKSRSSENIHGCVFFVFIVVPIANNDIS